MKALVFDLGGPLATESDQIPSAVERLQADREHLQRLYWEHRHDYDAGISSDGVYWSTLAGRELEPELAAELGRLDATAWARIRPQARQILADVHATGFPLWVLSNAPVPIEAAIDASDWRELVSGRFVSGVLRMVKPDEAIYAHVEQALDLPGDELAFIDDKPENLAAARRRGWTTHLWVDDADTRRWLVALGVLTD